MNHTLRGVIASKGTGGIITGTAKVIYRTGQNSKVKDGDILVAKTTRPEYVSAMQRAGGIVTAVGGVLSHAAIIAREFGTGAIVGVGAALMTGTKAVQDGDEITMNLETGDVTWTTNAAS